MRAHLRLLLLIAALLLGQLGGLAHGASHIQDAADPGHPACEWCLGYASLDHGLTGTPPTVPALAAAYVDIAARALPAGLAARPPYLSRAPPARLA
jgi:hypothetical protein